MRKLFLWLVVCFVEAVLVAAPVTAYATPSVAGGVTSTTAIINRIINSTPGINTVTTTGTGVTVSGAADVAVAGRGLTIPIAETATATVTAGRLAGMAARAIRFGGWVGVASVVIPWLAEQSGIKVCPPPDFFCKPGPDLPVDPTGQTGFWGQDPYGVKYFGGTPQSVCDKAALRMTAADINGYGSGLNYVAFKQSGFVGQCKTTKVVSAWFNVGYIAQTCPSGTKSTPQSDGTTTCTKAGPDVPASEGDIGTAVEGAVSGNSGRMGTLYDAVTGGGIGVFDPSDTVTVTAPPVTVPPVVTTNTVNNPDGTTSTVKTEEKTVVNPAVSGTNMGNTTVTYPVTTTTTTTTTNNNTNVTTTTTSITNYYGTPATKTNGEPDVKPPVTPPSGPSAPGTAGAPSIQFPTDYNREVTQGKVLDVLNSMNGPITATAPTGQDQLDAVKAQSDANMATVGTINEASTGLKAWFPSLPTAACTNPQVPNPVTGASVAVPICDKVSIFQTFISGVVCVLALFGSVREVQSAMKA